MNDEQLETELRSAVRSYGESVHPADRLGQIRAGTRGRSAAAGTTWWSRPWVLAAGTGLLAASVVTAAVVLVDTSSDEPSVAAAQREVTVYEIKGRWLYPTQVTITDADDPELDAVLALQKLDELEPENAIDECPPDRFPSSVEIGDNMVTIYFAGEPTSSSASALCAMGNETRAQQLAWTVRSAIGWEGPVRAVWGEAVRADPAAISPILIEAPVDGATLTSPVTISGTSDTFEANVVWEVTGDEIAKGGSTMGGTLGERARFEFTVDLPPGDYTARAYAEDMETGGLFAEDTVTFTVE